MSYKVGREEDAAVGDSSETRKRWYDVIADSDVCSALQWSSKPWHLIA